MNELERCEMFLTRNGWTEEADHGDGIYAHYSKEGSINIELYLDLIILIGDTGDFAHLPMNYFALVGALIEYRQVGFNYLTAR